MKDITDNDGKIIVSKELQKEMFKFFTRTSIPRNKKNKKLLSEKKKG